MRISLKRILTAMLSSLCIATILFSSCMINSGERVEAASLSISSSGTMTGDYVNLRSGAGMNYSVIGSLSRNELVTVLDTSYSDWVKVQTLNGTEGYCSKEFIKILSGTVAQEQLVAILTGNYVNLRAGSGMNYAVIGTLYLNEQVTVLDNSYATWVRIRTYGGLEGYVHRDYLTIGAIAAEAPEAPTETTGTVMADYLNIRAGKGTNTDIIGGLTQGANVTVLDNSDATWMKIRTSDGLEGYVHRAYLNIETTAPEAPKIPEASAGTTAAVTADYLNIRAGKGTNTDIIGGLTQGANVTVLDNSDATWMKIRTSDGLEGYVHRAYLNIETTAPEAPKIPEASAGTTAAVTADYLNIRAGKGTHTDIIGGLTQGANVTVLDNSDATWVKIRTSGGLEGYVHRAYLNIETTAPEVPKIPEAPTGTIAAVTADYLNIRAGKGTHMDIIGGLTQGANVTVLDNSDATWVKIRTSGGLEGYVHRDYLNIETTAPEAPEIPEAPTGTIATITVDYLNIRAGKGTHTDIIGGLTQDANVTVLDNSDATWVRVRTSGGLEGYVHRDYLSFQNDSNQGIDSTTKYAKVNVDILNVRSGMGTGYSRIGTVSFGEMVEVLDDSDAGWTKIKTSYGLEGFVCKDYLSDVGADSGETVLYPVTIPAGKTFYAASSNRYWYSSDSNVATASKGYITAVNPGTCTIVGDNGTTYSVTVTEGEAVRTAYASPNIAAVGESVEMVAVTDTSRDSVQFRVTQSDGTIKIVNAYNYTTEYCNGTATRVFRASTDFGSAGTHKIQVHSVKDSVMSATGYQTDAYTVWSLGNLDSTYETRRVSDKMIDLISNWEGYNATVYPDHLAGGTPTIGYGQTFGTGVQFYNNLSKTEAWSLLVKSINAGSYTSEVNRFLQNNSMKATQSQFDALVSFSYNIGSGYWNGTSQMDLREIMKNAVAPPVIEQGSSLPAYVTYQGANLYQESSRSASVLQTVNQGTDVQVLAAHFDTDNQSGWYQVRMSDGTVGWICSGYIRFASGVAVSHDLNYVDAHAFGSEMLLWHHAGGNCYAGLVYRRMSEAKVFSFSDYESAAPGSYQYQRNTYGYDIPDCIQGNGWIK